MINKETNQNTIKTLPRYHEITNVGLYLEQTAKFVNQYLKDLNQPELTNSMISNYVKLKLLYNPEKKQYSSKHIATLIFIALAKNVVSLDDIRYLLSLDVEFSSFEDNYNLFCTLFDICLSSLFSNKTISLAEYSQHQDLLIPIIKAITQKIYLDHCITAQKEKSSQKKITD